MNQDMNQSNIQDGGFRSLIDLSPIQPQREIPTLLPTLVGGVEGNQRSPSDGFPKTVLTMAALKGTRHSMFRIRLVSYWQNCYYS